MSPLDTSWIMPPKARLGPPAPTAREYDDYIEFCRFIFELTGIDLLQYKRGQMERRLRSLYARRELTHLTDVCDELRRDPEMLDELLDRITINVSQLWRNPEQWELIEHQLLPELVAEAGARRLHAWSAGCSYGAEAYTLATLCRLVCPEHRVVIQGTDIDRRMIERARLGAFSDADARSAPGRLMRAGFDQIDGGWRAKLSLRALTRFDVGDLMRMQLREGSFDLILCRNTVIYFTEPIRDQLHERFAQALRPGGFLMIGSTEHIARPARLGLTPVRPFIYRRD